MRCSRPLPLAGCSDLYLDRRESIQVSAGDAFYGNQVVMMVDPWPAASANRNIAFNGQRMQAAVDRYRHNKIVQPASPMTGSVGYADQPPAFVPVVKP